MRIVHGIDALPRRTRRVVTVGVFDGLHIGHLRVLGTLTDVAKRLDASPTVITFDPHPAAVVSGEAPDVLMDPTERLARFEAAGVDVTVVQRFDEAFRRTSAERFLTRIGAGGPLKGLVMTAESAFGRDRAGTLEALDGMSRRHGFEVVEAPRFELGGGPVSSSRIREHILAGRLAKARDLLGRPYAVSGDVVHGDARGRELGFPTANLAFGDPVALPPDGVYAVRVSWGGGPIDPVERADGVMSVGTQPTFGGRVRLFEVYLLDFAGDLYGERMRVELVRRLRGQQRFTSIDALIARMNVDVERARSVLAVPAKPTGGA